MEIRVLTGAELPAVERALPRYPGKHRERLFRQARNEGVYLVAWDGEEPVGHVFLQWPGPWLPDRGQGPMPVLEDVAVAPSRRRRGVGTLLMERCERDAAARGFREVGFAVALDNDGARAFYERLGYAESALPSFEIRYPYVDGAGIEQIAREVCTYFTKRLEEQAPDDARRPRRR